MAMTHSDDDAARLQELIGASVDRTPGDKIRSLVERAAELQPGDNAISAGKPGERHLYVGKSCGFEIVRLPPDPDCLRISIGMVPGAADTSYLVFRGDPQLVRSLLERAVAALRSSPAVAGDINR